MSRIYTEDSVPVDIRQCPKHKGSWIKASQIGGSKPGVARTFRRYCPRCEVEKAYEQKQKGPAQPIKVRIMKI